MSTSEQKKVLVCGKPELRTGFPSLYCPGCHYGIITRVICEVLEELKLGGKAIGFAGVGCSFGGAPISIGIDWASCPHGRAPAMASAAKRIHPDALVFTLQGDGDLGAIGLGCFLSAVLRNENLTTIFLNNAGYGQTGGQLAPTTLTGMKTTTTQQGRRREDGFPFHGAELAAYHKAVAYSARVTVHTPGNFKKAKRVLTTAFQKQMSGAGYSFVEFISACPSVWGMSPVDSVAYIQEHMLKEFPLGEFKNIDSIYD
ncbi:2-oxoglutarate oxidoreductase [Candidatus Poribacteria bacterium]|nr:2-oxoglutarate oxidoreductase [Candidatus Poribacteria bacterium]